MNGWLIISGTALICFADREAISTKSYGGTSLEIKYPFFGILMIIAGVISP